MRQPAVYHAYNSYFNSISYKRRSVEVPTMKKMTLRVYDVYGEEIDTRYHEDAEHLENIARGDWDGCDYAKSFTIFNEKNEEIVVDTF